MIDDPTRLHNLPQRYTLAQTPPPIRRPLPLLIGAPQAVLAALACVVIGAAVGYILGQYEARRLAERSDRALAAAEATLDEAALLRADAAAVCGGDL